ncbi:MAG: hypothetical protein ACJA1E_000217 [Paracoccaceae bacterium]|jgi:hypothetical protein
MSVIQANARPEQVTSGHSLATINRRGARPGAAFTFALGRFGQYADDILKGVSSLL